MKRFFLYYFLHFAFIDSELKGRTGNMGRLKERGVLTSNKGVLVKCSLVFGCLESFSFFQKKVKHYISSLCFPKNTKALKTIKNCTLLNVFI